MSSVIIANELLPKLSRIEVITLSPVEARSPYGTLDWP
jgi:hypothetical protein